MDEAFVIPALATVALAILSYILYAFLFTSSEAGKGNDVSAGLMHEGKVDVSNNAAVTDDKVLNPATFKAFKLIDITQISHNTKLFRFEIPGNKSIGLGIGRHISVRAEISGNNVIRAYTPTSHPNEKGYFELLIKTYEFGKLSPYLHSLNIGDTVDVRGPVGRFKYKANMYSRMGLIAGGTGLTPCLQVIRCVLSEDYAEDTTTFTLFYQNRTEEDILLREVLDELVKTHPTRLQIIYFLSNPSTLEFGSQSCERRGYISLDAIHEYLNIRICPFVGICGPSGFNDCMKGMLKKVGHVSEDSVYVW